MLLAVATHAQAGSDDGEFCARDVLALAAQRAGALSGGGGDEGSQQPPRAPEGRGYALDEGSDDEDDE